MKKFFRNNGLSIVFLSIFIVTIVAQIFTGFRVCNDEIIEEHGEPFTMAEYLTSGHFLEATFENWESEFLQMGLYVLLSVFLYQRGSDESNDPDQPDGSVAGLPTVTSSSSTDTNQKRTHSWLYENSLTISFFLLFLLSFALHFYGSLLNYNNDQILRGLPVTTMASYLTNSRFWFESFENWQSEFLSVFCVIVFTIFLRQKGSAQSKDVDASDKETGK